MIVIKKETLSKDFYSFANGIMRPISIVPDPVFAKKMLGDGYAIELKSGEIYAPIGGRLVAVFPTGHAYAIKTDDGKDVLIHIGVYTSKLDIKAFDIKKNQGDIVKQGDLLVVVDIEYIKSQDKDSITSLIFTSGNKIELLKENTEVTKESSNLFVFT